MSNKPEISVDDAYAVRTPADNIRLYADWAATYDSFVTNNGYVYHLRVAEIFIQQQTRLNGPVLDVGCGTGTVGVSLRNSGIEVVDGIDISPEMLAECRRKKTKDALPAYRRLLQADLTRPLTVAQHQYSGLISSGTYARTPGPRLAGRTVATGCTWRAMRNRY